MTAAETKEDQTKFRNLRGPFGIIQTFLLIAIPVIGVLYILRVFSYFGFVIWKEQYLGTFLSLALASVFLGVPSTKRAIRKTVPWYDLILALAGFIVGFYIIIFYPKVVLEGIPTKLEGIILGGVLIILGLEAARRLTGWVLVLLTFFFLFYGVFTHLFPGFLGGTGMPWSRLVTHIYLDPSGFLYLIRLAAILILPFLLFGQALFAFGGGKALTDLALSLTGRFRGGPAKTAVVASSLFGTISGSPTSNILVTGTITIPLMKQIGYKPHFAGAIEAVASSGGLLMPPVMGATAFVMADIVGVPYTEVAIAALIPAIIFYFALFVQVDLEAGKTGLKGLPLQQLPRLMPILRRSWVVLLPLVFITYALFVMMLPPQTAATYSAIFSLMILPALRENRAQFWRRLLNVIESVGRNLLNVTVLFICAGFIMGVVGISGLGFRLSLMLVELGGSHILYLLLTAAVASVIFGMGLPVIGAYILVAVLVAPALTQMGISVLPAHLFCFYYAMLSIITPPIASGVFVVMTLSRSSLMRTGYCAMQLAILAYIVPFLFVFSPALLLKGPVIAVVVELSTAMLGTFALGISLVGYFFRNVSLFNRVFMGLGAMALFVSITSALTPLAFMLKIVGLVLVTLVMVREWRIRES